MEENAKTLQQKQMEYHNDQAEEAYRQTQKLIRRIEVNPFRKKTPSPLDQYIKEMDAKHGKATD